MQSEWLRDEFIGNAAFGWLFLVMTVACVGVAVSTVKARSWGMTVVVMLIFPLPLLMTIEASAKAYKAAVNLGWIGCRQ